MKELKSLRKANRENSHKALALPPGFRKIFQNQSLDSREALLSAGNSVALPAIQITDPDDPNFGDFVLLPGYDPI